MIPSKRNRESRDQHFIRLRVRPKVAARANAKHDLRSFLYTAAYLLLYFFRQTIDEAEKTRDVVRGLLKTLRFKFRIPKILVFKIGGEPKSTSKIESALEGTEQHPRQPEGIRSALLQLADAVDTIQQEGGAVGFARAPLEKQLERATCDFPDDVVFAHADRKMAYLRLKDTESLPSPPGTALKIVSLVNGANTDTKQLTEIVTGDPAIAAKLLKFANSPLVKPVTPFTSIKRAIDHVGPRTLVSIAFGFSLVSGNRKGACRAFDYDMFWTECTARAIAARHIAAFRKVAVGTDDAFTAGLLCQIGRLALATALPNDYARVLSRSDASEPARLRAIERELFRIDHRELAAEMMAEWGLPEFFCGAVSCQDDLHNAEILPTGSEERALAMVLSWSETIWRIIHDQGVPLADDLQETVVRQAEELGIARSAFPDRFDAMMQEWSAIGTVFDVAALPVPAWADLVRQPDGT